MVRYIVLDGKKILVAPEVFEEKRKTVECKDIICVNKHIACICCRFQSCKPLDIKDQEIIEDKEGEYVKVLLTETTEHDGVWVYASKTYKEAEEEGIWCRDIMCGVDCRIDCRKCKFDDHEIVPLKSLNYVRIG